MLDCCLTDNDLAKSTLQDPWEIPRAPLSRRRLTRDGRLNRREVALPEVSVRPMGQGTQEGPQGQSQSLPSPRGLGLLESPSSPLRGVGAKREPDDQGLDRCRTSPSTQIHLAEEGWCRWGSRAIGGRSPSWRGRGGEGLKISPPRGTQSPPRREERQEGGGWGSG